MNIADTSEWLKDRFSAHSEYAKEDIRLDMELDQFKFDSVDVATFAADLGDLVDQDIDPTIFFEFDTIQEIIDWLKDEDYIE